MGGNRPAVPTAGGTQGGAAGPAKGPAPKDPATPVPAGNAPLRRFVYFLIIGTAAAMGLSAILTMPEPLQSANDRSRWCTVWSLVERGTYTIDEIIKVPGWDSIDKVRYRDHFYSTKPPLYPTIVAGGYWVLKRTAGLDLLRNTHTTVAVLMIVFNWLPWVACLILLAALVDRYARTDWSRIFVVFAAAYGTFLTPFLITFNNHTLAAICLTFAIYPAMRIVYDKQTRWDYFALSGFAAAYTVCNEIPAALFGVTLFLILMRQHAFRAWLIFVPAALIPIAGYFVTTWICTGTWKPFQSQYGTPIYRYVYEGIPSYWMNPGGIDQSHETVWVYLMHCVVGHHGILSLSPIFLLMLPGWWVGIREKTPWRMVCGLGLGLTVWVLGFYLWRTENYNYGGNTSGLRWAFWLIPLWLMALVPALDHWGHRWSMRVTSGVLLILAVFSAAVPHDNPWQPPWLQKLMEQAGWVNYKSPGEVFADRKIWLGAWPKTNGAWVELTGPGPRSAVYLRLESMPGADENGEVMVRMRWFKENEKSLTQTLHLSEEAVNSGASPEECLKFETDEQLPQGIEFLQGLMAPATYHVRAIKYLKTPLRTDAFRCRQAVATVDHRPVDGGPKYRYRRDVWLCDDVPFGVLQIEDSVIDPVSGVILSKQRLTATKVSEIYEPVAATEVPPLLPTPTPPETPPAGEATLPKDEPKKDEPAKPTK